MLRPYNFVKIVPKGLFMPDKITIPQIQKMTDAGEKISVITAYDHPTAVLVDRAGIDMVLVGDSVGNNILGYPSTVPVTMGEMIHHTKCVRRGLQQALLVGDMPFMSYQSTPKKAIENAGRFMKEAGTDAVKLEGGEEMVETIRKIVRVGIPVMGHIGYTPQRESQFGAQRVQGRDEATAKKILHDAQLLEQAGVFSIVLEAMPWRLAQLISDQLRVPTIGIGAGPYCDGQVLIITDVLGLTKSPFRFVKRYANLEEIIEQAVRSYRDEVKNGKFPTIEEHSFKIQKGVMSTLKDK